MDDMTKVVGRLRQNLNVLVPHAEGVSQEQSLHSLYEGGSSFNWMVGHLAASRDSMLEAAGHERMGDPLLAKRYTFGTRAPRADAAHELSDLLDLLARQGQRLDDVLPELTSEALATPRAEAKSSLGDFLTFMSWHETYHLGQAALYRGALGLKSVIG